MSRAIELKTRDQVRFMREAGLVVASIHAALREAAQAGVPGHELDAIARDVIGKAGAKSNFLGYYGYPASVCISINDVLVHGIPGKAKLRDGDIVKFDCGAYVERGGKQWHGDAAFTMIVGEGDTIANAAGLVEGTFGAALVQGLTPAEAHAALPQSYASVNDQKLRRRRELEVVTRESMWAALAALSGARRLSAVGNAVEHVVAQRAVDFGWEAGIIEDYTGHGIGTQMHQAPDVINFAVRGMTPKVRAGMVLAVEPMLTTGGIDSETLADNWTVRMIDGADGAQWEHTIAVLEDGVSVLTAIDAGAAGLAPYGVTPVVLD